MNELFTAIVMDASEYSVRYLESEWLPRICEIEERSFPVPWSRELINAEFNKRHSLILGATRGDALLGYVISNHVLDEIHILTFAVAESFRGMGLASALLDALTSCARDRGVLKIYLEVREGNVAAIGLYRKKGFEQIGLRSGYYRDNGENALVLALELGADIDGK